MVLTEQHSNAYKVGWALVAHALHPKRQPENAWATSAHPTKLRNSFQAAFGALEYNGFNGAAQQCVQGRGGHSLPTRCPSKGSLKSRGQQLPTLRNYGTIFRLPLVHWNTTVLTRQHSNVIKVGWALVAHALHPKGSLKSRGQQVPTLRNYEQPFRLPLAHLEHNSFSEAARQCVQGRVSTRCPRVVPPKAA